MTYLTAVNITWQADEHAATLDAAAHDNDEATAAVTDANADQDAADAWEKTEAPTAADQKAVDAADDQAAHNQDASDDQAAHNQDAAVKSGNDQIAQDQKNQQDKDASAAQTHDTQVATVGHDSVVQKASAADAAIQAAADAAAGQVQAEVAPAPAAIVAAVNASVSDAQAKNADQTTQSISLADTQRAALLNQVQKQVNANVQSAQQQRDTDALRSLDDPVIAQVNPPPPQSGWQTFIDYFPSWKTVAMVGAGIGLGAVALLVPGVGPVLFAVGMGMLAVSALSSAADRGFNQGQSVLQSLGGGLADATGVSAAYTGWTGEDLATGRHLGLTQAQQRQMLGDAALQAAVIAAPVVLKGGRSFFRGRQPAAPVPPATGETPPIIYREGRPSPSNLTPRPQDGGHLSFRDSLSNPIQPGTPGPLGGQRPVLRPGQDYMAIDTSKLPPGSVIPDGVPGSLTTPPGHVSVVNVTPDALKNAVIPKPPTPPYGPGASGKFPQ